MIRNVIFVLSAIFFGQVSGQDIYLSHWKITIPAARPDKPGSPIEVEPPEIFDFENNEVLKPYFYKD